MEGRQGKVSKYQIRTMLSKLAISFQSHDIIKYFMTFSLWGLNVIESSSESI